MIWRDNFVNALRGVSANKLRSVLTMLGVLIGVAAVIILVAVGTGSSLAVESQIRSLGTNTVTVLSRGGFGGPTTTGTESQSSSLTLADVKAISNHAEAPDVEAVSPVISTSETATYKGATTSASVIGSTPSYMTADDYTIAEGTDLTSAEVKNGSQDVLIGQTVLSDLFASGVDPVGQSIQLGSATFRVVGVLATKGTSGVTDEDDVIIAPYTAVQNELTGEASTFSELLVEARSSSDLDNAEAQVESILSAQTGVSEADLPFTIVNEASLLQTAEATTGTFTVLLGAVAAISLLVGGIGVMNIMLVSVTERTREIGIRKAIGAPKGVILAQFLFESVLLSIAGGVAGLVVGFIGSRFRIDGVQPAIAPYSVALALGVALVVGVFFGFYPANRAASLRPIDALRYE